MWSHDAFDSKPMNVKHKYGRVVQASPDASHESQHTRIDCCHFARRDMSRDVCEGGCSGRETDVKMQIAELSKLHRVFL